MHNFMNNILVAYNLSALIDFLYVEEYKVFTTGVEVLVKLEEILLRIFK